MPFLINNSVRAITFTALLVLHLAHADRADADTCTCGAACSCTVECEAQGAWYVADSTNFQVCSLRSATEAKLVAHQCESIRKNLAATWAKDVDPWNPRCQVILYANTRAYIRALGPGSESTLASAVTKRTSGKIVTRRIDLRTDVADYLTAALPHEMCHVVLADRLPDPPLWLDEGLAILTDPLPKQRLHERDLRQGLENGMAFTAEELMALKTYPTTAHWGVFYGQSASLVRHLLARGSASELVELANSTNEMGANLALRETYGFSGLRDIDRLWRNQLQLLTQPVSLKASHSRLPADFALTRLP